MTTQPKKSATYVELEHKHGLASFFCPVCGDTIVSADEGLAESLCEHVVLVEDWVGEVTARDEEIQELVDAAVEKADKTDGYPMELLRKEFGPNVVFFESFEPGHGPKDPTTFTVAVDMGMAGRKLND